MRSLLTLLLAFKGIMAGASSESDSLAMPAYPILDTNALDQLEEKAYDYDDGAEIAELYGPTLLNTYRSHDENYDQAGRIIGICIRNNQLAAQHIAEIAPDLPDSFSLDKRSLNLLSALVSTYPGRVIVGTTKALDKIQRQVSDLLPDTVNPKQIAQGLSSVLRTLGSSGEGVDSEKWCSWVATLQQAYYVTKEEIFKTFATDIVEHNDDFSDLTVQCKPQPGLGNIVQEQKRAVETEAAMPNKFAARNHFDL